jgi:hypothetical protein
MKPKRKKLRPIPKLMKGVGLMRSLGVKPRKGNVEKPTLSRLKKKLDAEFSKWIRRRDTKNGLCECYTCGKKRPPEQMQCGHYVPRRHLTLRWDARNCHAQDVACNVMLHGAMDSYAVHLIRDFGPEILEEFEHKKHQVFLPPGGLRDWLNEQISFYKSLMV